MAPTTRKKAPRAQPWSRAKKKAMASAQRLTAKRPKAKGIKRESGSRRKAIPQAAAIVALAPCYNASALVTAFSCDTFGEIDFFAAAEELTRRCDHVRDNQTGRMEDMLVAQAHSLDVMFASLARRADMNIRHGEGGFLNATDTYMKLALRAQNQCRMTIETLATIKNPPVVFARQANIANNQQVNNGDAVPVAHAAETGKPQPEQSRLTHGERQSLDFGTQAQTGRSDTAMATVEEINGAENRGG